MEVVDDAVLLSVPGATGAGPGSWVFRGSLAVALPVAFVVTLPVDRWLIARSKGHAVVHDVHGSSDLHGGHGTHESHAGHGGRLTARR